SRTTVWPISPPAPRPTQIFLSSTTPPPTPVPQKTPITDPYGSPDPNAISAAVPTRTSLPRLTGRPNRSVSCGPSGNASAQFEITLRAWATVPALLSTLPGEPTPRPDRASGSTPASSAAARTALAIPAATPAGPSPFGVGTLAWPSTWSLLSTTTVWILVPPRSA